MSRKITRRDLVKMAAAATGAAAISTIPNKWVTPIVEIGALPAHAQGSLQGTITGNVVLGRLVQPATGASAAGVSAAPRASTTGALRHIQGTVVATRVPGGSTYQTDFDHVIDLFSTPMPIQFGYTIKNVPPGTYNVVCTITGDDNNRPFVCTPEDRKSNVPVTPGQNQISFSLELFCLP